MCRDVTKSHTTTPRPWESAPGTVLVTICLACAQVSWSQIADSLFLLLPGSPFYPVISTLPLPDATNPTATTTFVTQSAIHNSLPTLEEIIAIFESHEKATFEREVSNRRQRLGAGNPEQVQNEVGREIWGQSRVSCGTE